MLRSAGTQPVRSRTGLPWPIAFAEYKPVPAPVRRLDVAVRSADRHGDPVTRARSTKRRSVLPGVAQFRGYQRGWLRGDLLAGITVAAYLVPQVMAYAEVAGLPPVTGLWAILGPLAVYALLGSSRQLSVGPESTTALMTAVVLLPLTAGDPVRYATLAAALAVMVGLICVVGGLARLGFLADLLSKPVLVGYMAGVAVIMIVSQLGKISGVPVEGDGFLPEVGSWLSNLGKVHWPTLLLAAGLLTLLFLLQWLLPLAPGPLIVVVLGAVVVAVFSLQDQGVAVVGAVPVGLPVPQLPRVSAADIVDLLFPALGVAIVGYTDNVLTARAFGARHGQQVDANQEWFALGGANISAGLLRGFPVSSSGSRTALGDAVGSKTQLYSLVTLVVVLTTLVVAGPLLAGFPKAALGALVIYAAVRLIEVGELRRIARFRRSELLLTILTTVAVLGFGVLYGVLVAVGLSIVDLLRRLARPHDGILGYVPGVAGMHDVDDYPAARQLPGLVVYRYDSLLCFANAEDFRRRALDALGRTADQVEWFILNAEANVEIDITAADSVDSLRQELNDVGITFAMARVKQDLLVDLRNAGLVDRIGAELLFPTLPTAVAGYLRAYQERHGALPPGVRPIVIPPDPMAGTEVG